MDKDFKQAMLASNWSSVRSSAEMHLETMSTRWSQEAYAIAFEKVRELTSKDAPTTDGELTERFSQSMGLTSIIGAVAHIELMLRKYPSRDEDRLALVKAACSLKLPTNSSESSELHSGTMAITTQVASISFNQLSLARRR